jgi:galactokinase
MCWVVRWYCKKKRVYILPERILKFSEVPLGKGVSSSASIEVATMKVLAHAFGLALKKTELPLLAQRVENYVVGAPCGLMDQLACYLGQPKKILPILCQPDLIEESITIPEVVHSLVLIAGFDMLYLVHPTVRYDAHRLWDILFF